MHAQLQRFSMHACERCGGLWLDTSASSGMSAGLSTDCFRIADRVTNHTAEVVCTKPEPLACPVYQKPHDRTLVAGTSIDIDVCPTHGTWYDCGEPRRAQLPRCEAPSSSVFNGLA